MERWSLFAGKRALILVGIALIVFAAPRVAMAQDAQAAAPAQEDPLKFATSAPVVIGWQVKADKTKEFEEGWAGIRALIANTDNAELRAFGETLAKMYRVDQPPVVLEGNQAVIYLFQLDAPSTTHSYNPVTVIYTYLGAGVEGSKVTRAEGDALYAKITAGFLAINPIWRLIKVG